jgi:hypothetical protein
MNNYDHEGADTEDALRQEVERLRALYNESNLKQARAEAEVERLQIDRDSRGTWRKWQVAEA